jgi:hypothetical protein
MYVAVTMNSTRICRECSKKIFVQAGVKLQKLHSISACVRLAILSHHLFISKDRCSWISSVYFDFLTDEQHTWVMKQQQVECPLPSCWWRWNPASWLTYHEGYDHKRSMKKLPAAVHFGNKWLENQKLMHQSTMNAYCISQLPAVSDCGYEETRYSIPPFLNPKPTSRFACSGHIWVELKACKKRCCGHVHTVYKASNDFHIWNKLSYLKLLYGTCFTDCRRLIV